MHNQFKKPLYICTQRYMFSLKILGFCGFLVVKGSHTDLHRFDPRRPYSIKTRIKTAPGIGSPQRGNRLADHIPLKQGLGDGGKSSDPSDLSDLSPQTKASPNIGIRFRPYPPRAKALSDSFLRGSTSRGAIRPELHPLRVPAS